MVLESVQDDEVAGTATYDDDFRCVGIRGVGHCGWDDNGRSMGVQGVGGDISEAAKFD